MDHHRKTPERRAAVNAAHRRWIKRNQIAQRNANGQPRRRRFLAMSVADAWRVLRAEFGDCTVPEPETTSWERRNA